MDEITGILSAKIVGVGTLSEGLKYYIKPIDDYANRWPKILVRKKTHLWQNDPVLHKFIDKKVLILGEIIETKSTITVDYEFVELLDCIVNFAQIMDLGNIKIGLRFKLLFFLFCEIDLRNLP